MSKKINILIEAGDINPFFVEGTKNIVLMHAKELVKRKHNVIILTRRKSKITKIKHPKRYEKIEDIKFYRWDNYFDLAFLYKILIKKEKIDLINIFSKGLKPLSYIKFLKYFIKKPIVFSLIGFPYSKKYSKKRFIGTAKNVNLMIMSSNYIFEKTRNFLGDNYLYLPYGIDTKKFKPKKIEKRKKIACLRPPKKELLTAFKKINDEIENVSFVFNKEDLEKSGLLKKLVEKKEIKIELIPELRDVSLLLNNINLLVDLHNNKKYLECASPPLLILEAMSCGTKIISTKMGEISEFLENNKDGFLVDNNDSDHIYEAIKKALNTRIPLGKNARKIIIKKYDIKKIIKKYEGYYEKVIKSN